MGDGFNRFMGNMEEWRGMYLIVPYSSNSADWYHIGMAFIEFWYIALHVLTGTRN